MGCLKYLIRMIGIAFIGIAIIVGSMYAYMFTHDPPPSYDNVSEEMYDDTQELLNVINKEFQSFNLSATVSDQKMDKVLDIIETFTIKYVENGSNTSTEDELLIDVGKVVNDYFQLSDLDLSYQEVALDFNDRFGDYSDAKRDIYEGYMWHRAGLRDKYDFEFDE